jgi:DNA-binding HxlR family transcriptional regulator
MFVPQSTEETEEVIGAGANGGTGEVRAGATMLILAADPDNRRVLRKVSEGPVEWSAEKIAQILPSGEEVLFISFTIEQWLQKAPGGAMAIDSAEGKRAVPALAGGWSATLVHALAMAPRSLPELEREVPGLGAAPLRRHLEPMIELGLVEAGAGDGEGTIYRATDWLRAGIAPLIAAARFERRYAAAQTPPIEPLDVEAGFLMALPLVGLPIGAGGICRMVFDLPVHGEATPVGVMAQIEHGSITAVSTAPGEDFHASLRGPPTAWLDSVINPLASRLYPEGDEDLATDMLVGLHEVLFGVPVR